MTDDEIIKALNCHTGNISKRCQVCPYTIYGCYCLDHLHPDLLDLINRLINNAKKDNRIIELQDKKIAEQMAEIDRLQDYNENLLTVNTALSNEILEIKFEVIKELKDRLKGCKLQSTMDNSIVTMDIINKVLYEIIEPIEI